MIKKSYATPQTTRHESKNVVQGSLYTVTLYSLYHVTLYYYP